MGTYDEDDDNDDDDSVDYDDEDDPLDYTYSDDWYETPAFKFILSKLDLKKNCNLFKREVRKMFREFHKNLTCLTNDISLTR